MTVLHERGNKCCSVVFEIPTALDCFEDGCAMKFPCGPGLYQNWNSQLLLLKTRIWHFSRERYGFESIQVNYIIFAVWHDFCPFFHYMTCVLIFLMFVVLEEDLGFKAAVTSHSFSMHGFSFCKRMNWQNNILQQWPTEPTTRELSNDKLLKHEILLEP